MSSIAARVSLAVSAAKPRTVASFERGSRMRATIIAQTRSRLVVGDHIAAEIAGDGTRPRLVGGGDASLELLFGAQVRR